MAHASAIYVIPTEVEEWSEWHERHGRFRREGSGERVGRRTSSISNYFCRQPIIKTENSKRCLPAAAGLDMTSNRNDRSYILKRSPR